MASSVPGDGVSECSADPVISAKAIGDVLPAAIQDAEAAGMLIIAQHLRKALTLAQRIAASGHGKMDHAG